MANVTVTKDRYTVDSLYQWSKDQDLIITGLSLASIPEIHFTNDAMDKAIVKQATMDDAGVITARIPNSLLQKPYKIRAYVCIYEGESFRSLYLITIPIEARSMPNDYTLTVGDDEVYSFNALENLVNNTVRTLTLSNSNLQEEVTKKCDDTVKSVKESNQTLEANLNKKYEDTKKAIEESNGQLQTELNQKYADAMESCKENFETQEQKFADDVEALTRTVNARVDNLIANNPNTDGNSELIDIRTGADGKTYGSAGEAVRGQFADYDKDLNVVIGLIKSSKNSVTNADLKNEGYIQDNGTFITYSLFLCSEMFAITDIDKITVKKCSGGTNHVVAFYKDNDFTEENFISGFIASSITNLLPVEIDVPLNAKYVAFSNNKSADFEVELFSEAKSDIIRELLDKTEIVTSLAESMGIVKAESKSLSESDLVLDGYIDLDGTANTASAFLHSELHDVRNCEKITINACSSLSVPIISFYSSNEFTTDSFIVGYGINITTFPFVVDVPKNAKYVAFSNRKNYDFSAEFSRECFYTNPPKTFEKTYTSIASIISNVVLSDKPIRINLLGDSITYGVGSTSGNSWAELFKQYMESKFNVVVTITGQSGWNSDGFVDSISTLIKEDDDIIICSIGTNDRAKTNTDTIQSELYNNLQTIGDYVYKKGKSIIFVSPIPSAPASERGFTVHCEDLSHVFVKACYDMKTEYINLFDMMIDYCDMKNIEVDSLLADGLHPNDNGYMVIFKLILKSLGISYKVNGATW